MRTYAETLGIEPVPPDARHGRPRQLFSLWFSANLGMPAWLVGVLGPILGLSWGATVIAILVGNSLASLLLGLTAAAGSGQGLAQLPLARAIFGRRGNYVPALLNTLSSLGWYTVNTAVGGAALAQVLGWSLAPAMATIATGQILIGYLGYDTIHRVEKGMAWIQAILFVAMMVAAMHLVGHVPTVAHFKMGIFLLEIAAVASYSFSWAPYASDYARYLPVDTRASAVFWHTYAGSWLSSVWVETLGALVGAMGWGNGTPVQMVSHLMGRWKLGADWAIVFGTITANALNGYTATLSMLTLDVKVARTYGAVGLGLLGAVLAYWASSHLMTSYENFLLLISYWVAPWIGIVLVGRWGLGQLTRDRALSAPAVYWKALTVFVVSIALVVPFMSTTLWTGPVAKSLHGGDIGYYVGITSGAILYWGWSRIRQSR